jgi:hypothetical protein
MATQPNPPGGGTPIEKIVVRIQVGKDRMAGSDDPLFLGLRGAEGREFRLELAKGRALRRGAEDVFVLGVPGAPETNVAHAELNDPTSPPIALERIEGVFLRKGLEPIPNVRGLGEMDDRLQVDAVEVELHGRGHSAPVRFRRPGTFWLGLVSGLRFDLPPVPGES